MKGIKLIVFLLVCASCSCNKETITHYEGFYDTEKTKIKMRGTILNGFEEGRWEYFDENGSLVQFGKYNSGIQEGSWSYYFTGIDSLMTWEKRSFDGIEFSLPLVFKKIDVNNHALSTYTEVDTIEQSMFSINDLGEKDTVFIQQYFDISKKGFIVDAEIKHAESLLIKSDNIEYYLDDFLLLHKTTNKEIGIFMVYELFKGRMIVLTFTYNPIYRSKAKFLLGDIFYHTKLKGERIANPFASINEIIK